MTASAVVRNRPYKDAHFTNRVVTISLGDVCAEFLPDLGGALSRLSWCEMDLLRRASSDCSDPRETACFPLAPFANRISNGIFSFNDERISITGNSIAAPHAVHGFAWQHPWSVSDRGHDYLTLKLNYEGTDWPWATRLQQHCKLTKRGAELSLSITNASQRPMPTGLGFHPYFLLSPDTRILAEVRGSWHPDNQGIANQWSDEAEPWFDACSKIKAPAAIDLCCSGWSGTAEVSAASVSVRLTASSNLPYLHFYLPSDARYFCIEPVSHAPDAPNRNDVPPLTVLNPQQSMTCSLLIEAI